VAEVVIILLASTVAFALVARRLNVPDAIVLVLAGLALGLVPGLPHIELRPEYVFAIVLPPLLHAQASLTSWKDFREHLRGISLLAIGLTLFTTAIVAFVTHALIPEIPLSCGFVLGAIVSPPDAVAASSIAKALKLPPGIVTILEGESLVNDATGLVAYRFAVAAIATGTFSLAGASGHFLLMASGGVAVGLAIGFAVTAAFRGVRDDTITIALSVVAPYASWYVAERLQVSSVLAAVTGGIVIGAHASRTLSASARLQGAGFWNTLVFLLNGGVFLMIGLQLPGIFSRARGESSSELLFDGLVVFAATVLARLVWVFPAAYLPTLLFPDRRNVKHPRWKHVLIVGWSGMRGVVSLAAALALPLVVPGGAPFPCRDRLIFLSFCVVLGTLVLQGLTLPWLIDELGVGGHEMEEEEQEREARVAAAQAALATVVELGKGGLYFATATRVVANDYEDRVRELNQAGRFRDDDAPDDDEDDDDTVMHVHGGVELRRKALEAERAAIAEFHLQHELGKELLLRLEREIDMAESRLPKARRPAKAKKKRATKAKRPGEPVGAGRG
jgi:CPA1 family monovalent cation:H+ antiporter